MRVLPVTFSHSLGVAGLPHHRRDPFDRMFIAQAKDDRNFDQVLELQLGKVFSPRMGIYSELLLGDDVLDSKELRILIQLLNKLEPL